MFKFGPPEGGTLRHVLDIFTRGQLSKKQKTSGENEIEEGVRCGLEISSKTKKIGIQGTIHKGLKAGTQKTIRPKGRIQFK